MRKGVLLVLLSACLAFVGACDDDGGVKGKTDGVGNGGGGAGGSGSGGGTGGRGGTGGENPGGYTIRIDDFSFSPAQLTVPAGATVVVRNADGARHSVTSGTCVGTNCVESDVNGVAFDTEIIEAGGSATFTIPADAAPGTEVPYFCVVNPGVGAPPTAMRNLGSIIVE